MRKYFKAFNMISIKLRLNPFDFGLNTLDNFDRQIDGSDRLIDIQIDGWIDRLIDTWMDEQMLIEA